ncbi:hypothetical protein EDB92DRAFT_1820147 [Lactarius akahatsu]|uniref:Peptidase S53 activation domain-containing protein n=1 Tax=Lactarius akahatsu TaxID=416441 RepID=A0AAD4LCP3_9AGAM|nr:hypothetical protein EDB92DRAFT_1820147 [Lactarius akahatsu]
MRYLWPSVLSALAAAPLGASYDFLDDIRVWRVPVQGKVAGLVAPHPRTLELVNSWLEHHGISSSSVSRKHGGGWLTVPNVLVSQVNDLLSALNQLYKPIGTNQTVTILRTVGYALSAALHAHVRTVAPTTHFGPSYMLRRTPRKRSREVVAMEKMTSGEPVTDRNALGLVGFTGSYPSQKDLMTFMNECRGDAETATFNAEQVDCGGNDPSHPGSKANQNIQYTKAMAYPTPLIFYGVGGNAIRAKFGALGVSVLFTSGNQGVGDGSGGCKDKGRKRLEDPRLSSGPCAASTPIERAVTGLSGKVQSSLAFPGSRPWVTSVGGTKNRDPEVGTEFSGGGFSLFFARGDCLPPATRQQASGFYKTLLHHCAGLNLKSRLILGRSHPGHD